MLIADQREAIEAEPRRVRRFLRTRSAILYGLAKRLAPHRRIIFLISFIWFFVCLAGVTTQRGSLHLWPFVEMGATFMLMTLLLARDLADKIKIRDALALARDLQ